MQCATCFHLCSARSSEQVDVSAASEVSLYGLWRRTTNTISGAITTSSCKTFLLFLALPQNESHTVTGSAISLLQAAGPSHVTVRVCRPILRELPPQWPPLSFFRAVWPHSIHLRPATPTCTPAHGDQAISLCPSCSKCLVRRTKTFSPTSVRKSNILSNRNEK